MNFFEIPHSDSTSPDNGDDDSPPDLLVTAKPPWHEAAALEVLLPVLSLGYRQMKPDFAHLTHSEISLLLCDDDTIAALNQSWRGKIGATNVLAFSQMSAEDWQELQNIYGERRDAKFPLGDIVIANQTCLREAEARGIEFTHHLAHLFIHGFLHLLGFDHHRDSDAQTMQRLETVILQNADIPNPYPCV